MAHGEGGVGLFVEAVCDQRDGRLGDELAEEDDAAFAGGVFISGLGAGDVEAEIDLGETGVEGDRETSDADPVEEEADERDEAAAFVQVELHAGWEVRGEDGGVDLVLRHDELAPVGG